MSELSKTQTKRENRLIKAIWFMRIACLLFALMLLAVIVACGITTTATVLLTLAVASSALGLLCGISYLNTAPDKEMTGETNG